MMSRLQLSLYSWTQHHSALQQVNHQVGPHDMGRTDVRAAAGGFQDVLQKCAELERSLRYCGILRLSTVYHCHEIRTCFPTSVPRISFRNRRLVPQTNRPNLWEVFWSKTVAHPLFELGHKLHGRHPSNVKSSDRTVASTSD